MDADDRARLHRKLDELLDWREKLESEDIPEPDGSPRGSALFQQAEAVDLYNEVAWFAAAVLGSKLHGRATPSFGTEPANLRQSFISRLRLVWVFLYGFDGLADQRLIQELESLDSGDEPEIFKPASRRPGQARRPNQIALLRARAFHWDARLAARGWPTAKRRAAIEAAFRTRWDSIRKWQSTDALRVQSIRSFAEAGATWEDERGLSDEAGLRADGDAYWDAYSKERTRTAARVQEGRKK